ncbi:spore coat protein GerQ [Virgibacillus sp. 179-BFC.A HS]|uniref:Spore coat protein GerQ n=1 Tax=Tigheibacillus jepli TaxID=3035914 RepID=A0ABU5CDX9_9BACI|nr:spore coat protein GerQ [Virgibacillus sp. 179-BFC.A HS]MDY0404518.1 spore coat protein GerQ [Virgibacillus sp. 179-BFC.A HS]
MSESQEYYGYPSYPYFYYPTNSPAYYPANAYRQFAHQPQVPPQSTSPQAAQAQQQGVEVPGMMPIQQSYIENILRLNKDKSVTVHMRFDDAPKVFKGHIEAAGRDHIIIKDPQSNRRYLLLMVYLDYVVFDEKVNYTYPFQGAAGPTSQLSTYPPR